MKDCINKTNRYQYFKTDLVCKEGQISSFYIFRGFLSESDPREDMNKAIESIVGDVYYADFIEHFLDNPWCRVVITNPDLLRSNSSEDKTHNYSVFTKDVTSLVRIFILFGGDNLLSPWDDMTSIVADKYGNQLHQEFIESSLENPWDRVIIMGINDIPDENWHGTI